MGAAAKMCKIIVQACALSPARMPAGRASLSGEMEGVDWSQALVGK